MAITTRRNGRADFARFAGPGMTGRSAVWGALVLAGLWGLAGSAVLAQGSQDGAPTRVEASVDIQGASTRVVLEHERSLVYAVERFDDRVEIVYAQPVALVPRSNALDDALLRSWSQSDDRTIVLSGGPGFRSYEHFELRVPFRIVVDLRGDRGAGEVEVPRAAPRGADASRSGEKIVVLDPGHGGAETGALGSQGLVEKDVALDLARRLRAELRSDPGVEVVLTRDEDRHVPLDERTAIANHNRADLFVSIHLNAARRREAYGAETYFLSREATDDEARTLAALENGVPGAENVADDPELKRRGLDLVLWDLAQNRFLAESSALAEAVQRELNRLVGTRDRGVRQAPFRVLMGAMMPAILVEVGFVSNPDEERQLMDPGYRERVVEALARAVREYLSGLDTLKGAPGAGAAAGAPAGDADGGETRTGGAP